MRARGAAYVVALASGVLLSLAFPEPDLAPIAWISIAPLIALCRGAGARRSLALGAVYGVGFFGALLIWISLVGWVAWGLLVILEAAFVALFAISWAQVSRVTGTAVLLLGPAVVWVAVEQLRASIPLGGFPWGELAQSQHDLGWMLQPASWAGGRAVSFVIVVVNASIALAVSDWRRARLRALGPAAACAVVLGALFLGDRLMGPDARVERPLTVAIVQGNVPRGSTGSLYDKEITIIRSHRTLTERLAGQDIDLVIWPESSVGLDPERVDAAGDAIAAAARAVGAPMIVGGNLYVDDDHYQVVALQIDPAGGIVDRYQKTHLVPFGEYVPGRKLIGWIPMLDQVPRDAVAGTERSVFDVAGGQVATVISFEGDFGSLVRERIAAGGRFLVVATNTSTWGESWASAQHVAMSQVRAAENSVWVAHAALSGISAIIDPTGHVVARTDLWVPDVLVSEVGFADDASFYARTGDWLPYSCWAIAPVLVVLGWRRDRTMRRRAS